MTTLSVTEAQARFHELVRLAHDRHERFIVTRDGRPEAVLLSADELEGLELTIEVLADADSVAAITAAFAELRQRAIAQ